MFVAAVQPNLEVPGSMAIDHRNEKDDAKGKRIPSVAQLTSKGQPKRWAKRYRTEIAASTSSVLSTFFAFPLDSVKTRMQTYKYRNFTDCVKHTYQTERIGGFFRGVVAPLASVTLVRTISFSIYQRTKYAFSDMINKEFGIDPLIHINVHGNYPNLATVACFGAAGATAGSAITVIACPFELTKLSAQVSVLMADRGGSSVSEPNARVAASYQNKGTYQTAKNIIKHRGIGGLYSGFKLHLLRDTLGTGLYFATYESSKQLLATYRGYAPHSPLPVVAAGGLCGIVSWALIYPIDSVKSIYQRNCLTRCKGEEVKPAPKIQFFNRRMYRGLGVSMARSCVVNAIFFSSFEFIKKQVNALEDY